LVFSRQHTPNFTNANMAKPIFTVILFVFAVLQAFCRHSDADFHQTYQLHISRAKGPVKIDGDLTDSAWEAAPSANDFWKKYPNDIGKATRKTEVKMLFDDNFLYIGFVCHDSGDVIIQSLKHDIGHDGNESVVLVLDPMNQRQDGFWFVLNAFNAQSEDQLHYGTKITYSWDNKWYSQTKRYADHWTAEIAIPFKTLRYSTDTKTWGLNFVRVDEKNFEYSTWTHVPANFHSNDLGYTGALVWDEPPPSPGKNMVFIPYATGGINGDQQNRQATKTNFNAGFDGKLAITPSLNLDVTLNPDFSQVEVDKQVTNLTRYDIFLPEKRAFFLENADLFGGYGVPGYISPFYSRTIGLDKNGNRIPIIGGARLSGNVTKSTRIGIMNMETGSKGDYYAENFTALSVNQTVFQRSSVKGYFLNRENFAPETVKQKDPLSSWGRNAGLEFDYSNLPGTWTGYATYQQSYKPGIVNENKYVEAGGTYGNKHLKVVVDALSVGTNYYTDMGYVQRISNYDAVRDTSIRLGFKNLYSDVTYTIFPTKGRIGQHQFDVQTTYTFNPDNSFNEREHTFKYNLNFNNTSGIIVDALADDVNLLFPVAFTKGTPLPKANYQYSNISVGYYSDTRKTFSYSATAGGGGFYNGHLQTYSGGINWRKQPHVNVALQAEYDKLDFPGAYGSSEVILLSSNIEINFSTKIFWTTFLQYNTQQNNYNINSRFQYRYKPMSDIFLVYTDNYYTTPFLSNKNRAVVFKMNYWLNL